MKGFAAIVPPDADVAAVAEAIVNVVDAPFGKRPFRVHIDPTQDGAEVVDMVWTASAPRCSAASGSRSCSRRSSNHDGSPTAPAVHSRDRRAEGARWPRTPGTPAIPSGWRWPTRPTAAGGTAPSSCTGREEIVAFLTRKWAARARLPADQGAVGVRRQPHRRALRLRVARRQRQLVPLLRQRELGVRRARPDAAAHRQHQRPADRARPSASSTGRSAAGRTIIPG